MVCQHSHEHGILIHEDPNFSVASTEQHHVAPFAESAFDLLEQNIPSPAEMPRETGWMNRYVNVLPNPETRVVLSPVRLIDAVILLADCYCCFG